MCIQFSDMYSVLFLLGTKKEAIRATYFNMLLEKLDYFILEEDDLIHK